LFIWDDEIDGHPPYVRPTTQQRRNRLMNSKDKATSSGKITCDCNCLELVKDLTAIVEGLASKKLEKMKKKLHN
jgi:hypothetical protein